MPIQSGTHLGPYQITDAIGAGGMGEVYRARDTKLGRDVAIKVLPEAFAGDAARMARFRREAKVLASLNHPNIAAIYGFEDSNGAHALVMELVEGPTLADRIKDGPIPIDEALKIAKQICEALEYAHERGIVHRDLKPANVKLTNEDAVKVLDFGLAKALDNDASSIDISSSPTLSRMATMQGVLLGTAAYMSPEQAKAKPVDRRADIWAFGCVLYEMLTGKTAFSGETVTDTLAAVVMKDPDWSLLPTATPARVRVLLQRCLQKDPKQRLRDIGDARISLDEAVSDASAEATSPGLGIVRRANWRHALLGASVASLVVAVVVGLAVWNLKTTPPQRPVTRFALSLPPGQRLGEGLALSPDGIELAYVTTTPEGGAQQMYLRAMDSMESRPIPGTEGAVYPFFSPDEQWLGFFAGGKLKKVWLSGGTAQTLADAPVPYGASWGSHGTIVFAPASSVLKQVTDEGSAPQPLTRFEEGESWHNWPEFLPGSKAVLFDHGSSAGIAVQVLGTGERRDLIQGRGGVPRYAASGHLVYWQAGNLMAVPFDPERLEIKGTPVPVVRNVLSGDYSISATGSLAYVPGSSQATQSRMVWVSRNGVEQPLAAPVRDYHDPRLSPDGRRIAVGVADSEGGGQVWLYDLARETLTRLTFEGTINAGATWTPDGKRIAYMSNKDGQLNVYWQMADGSGGLERLTTSEKVQFPISWSPNGQLLGIGELASATGEDIWELRLSDRKPQPFLQTRAPLDALQFSADGRWLAYASAESGRNEIYVQPYPGPGGKWQISTEGGTEPHWNRNGRELFYRIGDKMIAVDISTQSGFVAGKPRQLFEGRGLLHNLALEGANYDVSADGQRFLMVKAVEQEQAVSPQINVVLNWTEELKRLVPTGK